MQHAACHRQVQQKQPLPIKTPDWAQLCLTASQPVTPLWGQLPEATALIQDTFRLWQGFTASFQ